MRTASWEFEDGRLSSGGLGRLCERGVASSFVSPAGDGEGELAAARSRGSLIEQIPAPASDGFCGISTRLFGPLASVRGELAFFLPGGVLLVLGRGVWRGGSWFRRAVSCFLSLYVCARLFSL